MEGNKFDVASFMAETVDYQFDTSVTPIPEGDYQAQIGPDEKDVDIATGFSTKNQKPWMRCDLTLTLLDPNLAASLKREGPVKIRYGLMLDLNENGKLDQRPQRNVKLGQLRDALGQNKPGAWSWNMLKGAGPLKVRIKVKTNETTGDPYSEVIGVARG